MTQTDVILLGHGSRRGTDTDEGLIDAASRLQRLTGPGVRVRMAAFEFTRPSIPEAVAALVDEGSSRIVIVPFFLFDGKHVTVEIPEELETLRSHHPALDLRFARTLGTDSRLADLAVERVQEALLWADASPVPVESRGSASGRGGSLSPVEGIAWEEVPLGVIFVNRGTRRQYDPGDRLREMASAVETRLPPGSRVEPAQAEYESPTIQQAAAALAVAGLKQVVVLPYLFFPGKVLSVNILPAVAEAEQQYQEVTFRVAKTLGVDDRLIELTWQRAQEAVR